jgi:WD40 repeat protein
MSGAALFAGSYIVGVIVIDPDRFGTDRIMAIPTTILLGNREFAMLVAGRPDVAPIPIESQASRNYEWTVRGPHFVVPFMSNPGFAGRDEDLKKLDALVAEGAPVGITGMGGVGKTQLAVEYALKYQSPERSVFWFNAAQPLLDEFVRAAVAIDPFAEVATAYQQVQALVDHLTYQRQALLIFDNLEDPLELRLPLLSAIVPEALPCRILFTTRRANIEPFVVYPLDQLDESASLTVLLRHPSRRPAIDRHHPEHEDAREICRLLGNLPLALVIAGAHLGRFPESPIAMYRAQLHKHGALPVLGDRRAPLSSTQLATRHDTAIEATLAEQWDTLDDEDAKLLLQAAAQLPEAAIVPVSRLAMLTGLSGEGDFFGSQLTRAQNSLTAASLAEVVRDRGQEHLHVHPLVRDFTLARDTSVHKREFATGLASNLLNALEDVDGLGQEFVTRGIYDLQEDLISALALLPPRKERLGNEVRLGESLEDLLTLLQREAHQLRREETDVRTMAQQLHNRGAELGPRFDSLTKKFAHYLASQGQPWIRLRSRMASDRALLHVIRVSESGVRDLALVPGTQRVVAASAEGLTIRSLATGRRVTRGSNPGVGVDRVAVASGVYAISAGGRPGKLELWNLETLERREFGQHDDKVRGISISADGRFAATADYNAVVLWDLRPLEENGSPEIANASLLGTRGSAVGAQTVRFLDDRRLAIAGLNEHDGVWQVDDAGLTSPVCSFGPDQHFRAAAPTPDGAALVVADWGTIRVHDLASGGATASFKAHEDKIRSIDITSDGLAVSASDDGTIGVWRLSGDRMQWMAGHTGRVTGALVDDAEGRIITASADGTLRVWARQSGGDVGDSGAHLGPVRALICTADSHLVSAGIDGKVVKSKPDARTTRALATHLDRGFGRRMQGVRSLAVEGGRRFAVSVGALSVIVYDLGRGELVTTLQGAEPKAETATAAKWKPASGPFPLPIPQSPFATEIAVSTDGSLVVAQRDDRLCAWDFRSEPPRALLQETVPSVCVAAAVDSEDMMASTAFDDGSVAIWDLEMSSRRHVIPDIHPALLFPGGRFAITNPNGGKARVWDLYEARQAYEIDAVDLVGMTEDGILGVALRSDGSYRFFVPRTGNDADPTPPVIVTMAGGTRALAFWVGRRLNIELQSGPVATLGAAVTCRTAGPYDGSTSAMAKLEASPTALAVMFEEGQFAVGDASGSITVFRYEP